MFHPFWQPFIPGSWDFATHRTEFFCVGPRCSTSKNNIATWWNPRFFVDSWSIDYPWKFQSFAWLLISINLKAIKLKTRYFQLPHQKWYVTFPCFARCHHVHLLGTITMDPAGLNHWSWPPSEALLPGAPNPWRPPDLKTDEENPNPPDRLGSTTWMMSLEVRING